MNKKTLNIGNKICTIYSGENPEFFLIQPVDEHDLEVLDKEVDMLTHEVGSHLLLVAIHIENWNEELSPWYAPAVFGNADFGNQATDTLDYIENVVIPYVIEAYQLKETIPAILGGYSLAGLFVLWSAYKSTRFSAIAAMSPSVWFPKWLDFVSNNVPLVNTIYLSLGDKEERTKNKVMATVGDCIRKQAQLLESQGIECTLVCNKGNHFQESDTRCAKGFCWCIESLKYKS
ncbi:alpha/beta hydrolase-fold protein [Veillonella intestinalis]|uniref:alpha/beta hydrolase-fold protein n=1 Tax=Veillonella intestinalis TaxID=2941341 RepID=UPI002042016D|nr:alpha/beta hydrolase-fold protein [Veillonella intestinalis]